MHPLKSIDTHAGWTHQVNTVELNQGRIYNNLVVEKSKRTVNLVKEEALYGGAEWERMRANGEHQNTINRTAKLTFEPTTENTPQMFDQTTHKEEVLAALRVGASLIPVESFAVAGILGLKSATNWLTKTDWFTKLISKFQGPNPKHIADLEFRTAESTAAQARLKRDVKVYADEIKDYRLAKERMAQAGVPERSGDWMPGLRVDQVSDVPSHFDGVPLVLAQKREYLRQQLSLTQELIPRAQTLMMTGSRMYLMSPGHNLSSGARNHIIAPLVEGGGGARTVEILRATEEVLIKQLSFTNQQLYRIKNADIKAGTFMGSEVKNIGPRSFQVQTELNYPKLPGRAIAE